MITKAELERLYWDKGLSANQIARTIGVHGATVRNWFRRLGIPLRNTREATKLASSWKRTIRVCANCGKEVAIPQNELRHGYRKGIFCSYRCHAESRRRGEYRYCVVCGKRFYIHRCKIVRGDAGKYCSRKCSHKDNELIMKRAQNARKHPNKLEQKVIELIQEMELPYKYVGDGQVILNGYNPDFINTNGKKKVIEVFGDYWHGDKAQDWHEGELGRMMLYGSLGFDCLIVWESELKDKEALARRIRAWDKKKAHKGV